MKTKEFTFRDATEKKISAICWAPESGEIKAVVHILHGWAEHCRRYGYIAQKLTDAGVIVYAHDHKAHGQSDADSLGYIKGDDGFHQMVETIKDFRDQSRKDHPDLPLFFLGHSMGSFLVQRYVQLFDEPLAGIVYSGSTGTPDPLIYPGLWVSKLIMKIKGEAHKSNFLDTLTFKDYNRKFKPNRSDFDWLSRDEQQVDAYVTDEACGFISSAKFYNDLFRGLLAMHSHKPFCGFAKDVPLLILGGGSDPVSNMGKGLRNLEQKLKKSGASQVEMKMYEAARHEILNETNREEVAADILQWMQGKYGG